MWMYAVSEVRQADREQGLFGLQEALRSMHLQTCQVIDRRIL
jgi:hypothetical protein